LDISAVQHSAHSNHVNLSFANARKSDRSDRVGERGLRGRERVTLWCEPDAKGNGLIQLERH
jgi:hypothetical protein